MKRWPYVYGALIAAIFPLVILFGFWQNGMAGQDPAVYTSSGNNPLKERPEDPKPDGQLAMISKLIKNGRMAEAEKKINEVLKQNPADVQGRFLQGVVLTEQGKIEQAIEVFKGLIKDHPSMPEPYNNLAVLYAANNQYEQARDTLLEAINTHPSYATAYRNLSDIYAIMAGKAYNRALTLWKKNEIPRASLALITNLSPALAALPEGETIGTERIVIAETSATEEPSESPPAEFLITETPASTAAVTVKKPPPITDRQQVIDTIKAWAATWASQNVEAYLSFYAPDFDVSPNATREEWEQIRRQRISLPAYIKVSLSKIQVDFPDTGTARVRFTQTYRSDLFRGYANKRFLLKKVDAQWKIVQETVK